MHWSKLELELYVYFVRYITKKPQDGKTAMEKNEADRITENETAALFALLDRADELFMLAKSPDDLRRISHAAFQEIECRRYARSLSLAGFGLDVRQEPQ